MPEAPSVRAELCRRIVLARFTVQPGALPFTKVAPKKYTLDEKQAIFETFLDLAHRMGARQVQKGDATLSDDGETVVLFFSHSDFPAARFGYRVKTSSEDAYEEVWLAEELATGALHRIMRDAAPTPDDRGITWLRLHGQLLRADS